MWGIIAMTEWYLRQLKVLAVSASCALGMISCLDECDREGRWCEENMVVGCTRGTDDPYSDCDVFNMICVETTLFAEDRPLTTCALSDQPCEADEDTICIGNRLGVCGITEYPVCEKSYHPGLLGRPSDCEFCE